jgi:hypothetical protein
MERFPFPEEAEASQQPKRSEDGQSQLVIRLRFATFEDELHNRNDDHDGIELIEAVRSIGLEAQAKHLDYELTYEYPSGDRVYTLQNVVLLLADGVPVQGKRDRIDQDGDQYDAVVQTRLTNLEEKLFYF